ncbi:MAG: transcriptional regulator [Flavobacteriaceae bacterium]|nr:transcriptional regulator [Flavobacteriaceae bacterium]
MTDMLGRSFNTDYGYVQNRNHPSPKVLCEIARILNINPKELLS